MSTIPYDPSLVLGQLVNPERIDELMEQAEIQKPYDRAYDKFNTMVLTVYKFDRIYQQMINMGVEGDNLMELTKEKEQVRSEMVQSAIDLGRTTMKCEAQLFQYKMSQSQKQISKSAESPVDFANSPVIQFPASFDTMKFDVQMFRNESNDQSSSAHSTNIASKVSTSVMGTNPYDAAQYTVGVDTSLSINSSMASTAERHEIDSTIVITCIATHKQADIIQPCIIHPVKGLNAWNATFPNDTLETDPMTMFMEATKEPDEKNFDGKANCLNILSGCTKGSSFVGYVHILKTEQTTSQQQSMAVASAVKVSIERSMQVQAISGNVGVDTSTASTAASLMSTSNLQNSCSFVVTGCIPTIECNTVETSVKKLQPDPSEVMKQLGSIADASQSGAVIEKGDRPAGNDVGEAKMGGQFISLNNEHLKDSVSALSEYDKQQNKVIDINSMWTAFADYREQVRAGSCGIPTNFYLKQLTKPAIAKNYIRTFYPNGGVGEQAMKGAMGVAPS